MTTLGRHIFYLVTILSFVTCKKYPENNLWFKNPRKLDPFVGHITKYAVNGIDSLDLLNIYYGQHYGCVKDIRQAEFITQHEHEDNLVTQLFYGSSGCGVAVFKSFVRKKKYMKVNCLVDTSIFKKNIFINKEIEWQIVRLSLNGPFKIKTTLENGNLYEIEITP